jgi:UDP-N-acetylglucosamine 2-epimerase (non-hydrolysing)
MNARSSIPKGEPRLKVAIVLGTRPEIIKMSPVIRELEARGVDFFILHTGQHYDYNMDEAFFEELKLPAAKHNLGVGSGSHAEQSGKIMFGVEKVLSKEKPSVVLVQGDTNTVCSGALVASKMGLMLGHVEAGLRSFDRRMPEEINRVVADHLSDLLFAPTEVSRKHLLKEGINDSKIFVTGNTIVDAVEQNLALSLNHTDILDKLGVEEQGFFLITLHRAENVDDKRRLKSILQTLKDIKKRHSVDIVFPIHPRTKKMIKTYGYSTKGLTTLNPVGYLDFLQLEGKAKLILTDSGGVQEEACILKTPCLTLRDNTERPETVLVGANIVTGVDPNAIFRGIEELLKREKNWSNPYGEGRSGRRIIEILLERAV